MQRAFSSLRNVGALAMAAGVVAEFCLYDGITIVFWAFLIAANMVMICAVDAGTRAIIFDKVRGLQQTAVGEGTHFRIPFFQVRVILNGIL
jgi:uncharacterized membrane protein YqiK